MQNGDKSNGETWGRRANEVRRRGASTNDLQLRKLDNLSPKAGHSPRHDAKTCTPASRMLGLGAKAFKGTLPGWTWHAGISPAPSTLSKTAGDVRMMCEKVKGGEREPGKDLRKTHTHTHTWPLFVATNVEMVWMRMNISEVLEIYLTGFDSCTVKIFSIHTYICCIYACLKTKHTQKKSRTTLVMLLLFKHWRTLPLIAPSSQVPGPSIEALILR